MQIINNLENYFEEILKKPMILLGIIIVIGIIFRVYFTNWDTPPFAPDALVFMIEGISFSNGDFSYFSTRFLWPMFLSFFFIFFNFENNLGYFNLMKIVTILISVASIPVIYQISKHYVDKKYAIFASVIFALEPNIIENSLFVVTEPLFILCGLLSVYFLIQKNNKLVLFSFIFAGLSFDTRLNGIVLILIVLIFCILKIRKKEFSTKLFVLGCIILIFVIMPYIYLPLEYGNISVLVYFTDTLEIISSNQAYSATYSQTDSSIIQNAIMKELIHLVRISLPYLIFFVPIGVISSLKKFDTNKKILFSTMIISLIIVIPQNLISVEYRNLLFIIPIFCILSAIGIKRIFHNRKHQNVILVAIMSVLILVSFVFLTIQLDKDWVLVEEKEKFGKFVISNFSGKILGGPYNELSHNIPNAKIGTIEEGNVHNDNIGIIVTYDPIDSKEKLQKTMYDLKVNYIIVEDTKNNRYPIFYDIFENEEKYPELEKVFDSENNGYEKFKVKIFKRNLTSQ
jgi:hypothetical protein